MNETFPQPNQERNLSLERQEAVKKHNKLLKDYKDMESGIKKWDLGEAAEKYVEMNRIKDEVENIDEYKETATSKENLTLPKIGDISDVEKIKTEKEKVESIIEKTKKDVKDITNKLNELRSNLGMPPSDNIPSLMDKKENLGHLLMIQKDLENKLNFEIKKQEVKKSDNAEQNALEQKFIKDDLEGLSFALRGMVKNQDSFNFGIIASNLNDYSDMDDLKLKLSKIVTSVENFTKNGLGDNLDALLQDSSKLSLIEASLRNLPSKIKNEEDRKVFGQFISGIASKISENVSFIKLKVSKMQEYLNTKY